MKLTARNDQVTIKSQSKPDFASRKYGHWRKTASGEKSKVRALCAHTFIFRREPAVDGIADVLYRCDSRGKHHQDGDRHYVAQSVSGVIVHRRLQAAL